MALPAIGMIFSRLAGMAAGGGGGGGAIGGLAKSVNGAAKAGDSVGGKGTAQLFKHLKDTDGAAGKAGSAIEKVQGAMSGAMGKATGLASSLFIAEHALQSLGHFASHALTTAIDGLHAAASPFVNLTAKNNPALAEQFAKATEDAYGVVGRLLIPVTQSLTRAMRTMGDIMARMEPVFAPVSAAVGRLVDVSMTMLSDAVNQQAGPIETFGSLLLTLVNGTVKAAKAMQPLIDAIGDVFSSAGKAFGEGGNQMDAFVSMIGMMAQQLAYAVKYGVKPMIDAWGVILRLARSFGFMKGLDKAGKLDSGASALGAGSNTTKTYSTGAAIAEDVQLKALQQGLAGPKDEPPPDPGPILIDTNTFLEQLLKEAQEILKKIPTKAEVIAGIKGAVDALTGGIGGLRPERGSVGDALTGGPVRDKLADLLEKAMTRFSR